jgi:hypothetical protein
MPECTGKGAWNGPLRRDARGLNIVNAHFARARVIDGELVRMIAST